MGETVEIPKIDKSAWGPGPWQDEPDRVDFVHAGFACLARRHPAHGYWCGYVGLPPGHPLHSKIWSETDAVGDLHAHRGINYSALCCNDICHIPQPGMPAEVWWLGFDTGHAFDQSPGTDARLREAAAAAHAVGAPWADELDRNEINRMEVYRDLPYVRHEIEALAEQVAGMKGEGEKDKC